MVKLHQLEDPRSWRRAQRRVVQLTQTGECGLVALCDDGTLWARNRTGGWTELDGVPQPEAEFLDED